jgi:hypothetical protein
MAFSGSTVLLDDDCQLDMPDFKNVLLERWPDAVIKDLPDGDIDFELNGVNQLTELRGSTIDQKQIGWWGSTLESVGEFCVWFRQYVPEDIPLLAAGKDFYRQILVTSTTTRDDIVLALSGDPYAYELIFSSLEDLQRVVPHSLATFSEHLHLDLSIETDECSWFLKSQDGYILTGEPTIYFKESHLPFAAEFAIWCRSLTHADLSLTIPAIGFDVTLTSETTEQDLFEQLQLALADA